MTTVEVVPGGPVNGSIRPPGSKSLTNRALICAAFASGTEPSRLSGALHSEDTEVMIDAVRKIGCKIDSFDGGTELHVSGVGGRPTSQLAESLYIANSGTSIRFLTAALAAFGGKYDLHGVERMHQRPIGDLVDAIATVINGQIHTESSGGCPPVRIDGQGWSHDQLSVRGNVSSQYLSGLMMAAPIARGQRVSEPIGGEPMPPSIVTVDGELVSRPYVEMTAETMRRFGAQVSLLDEVPGQSSTSSDSKMDPRLAVHVGGSGYRSTAYAIEPDASAASYFWATAAISGGQITVEGLSADALQGDVGFVDVMESMGCQVDRTAESITVTGAELMGVDVDMNQISDTVQTLAMVALFADGPTRVRNVAHNRFKETDRIGDLAREIRKMGARVDEHDDGMTIHPFEADSRDQRCDVVLDTYNDHRMAMSFALPGLRRPGIRIADPACTAKTYPEFFADFEQLIGRAHRWTSRDG